MTKGILSEASVNNSVTTQDLEEAELRLFESLWSLEAGIQNQHKILKNLELKLDRIILLSSQK